MPKGGIMKKYHGEGYWTDYGFVAILGEDEDGNKETQEFVSQEEAIEILCSEN
jgi:hypothetical protein